MRSEIQCHCFNITEYLTPKTLWWYRQFCFLSTGRNEKFFTL